MGAADGSTEANLNFLPRLWEIRKAVEQMYNVVVESVNTINEKGKLKARYTKAGYLVGRTNAVKKAIVTLKEGDKIDFYSNI